MEQNQGLKKKKSASAREGKSRTETNVSKRNGQKPSLGALAKKAKTARKETSVSERNGKNKKGKEEFARNAKTEQ